VLSNSQEPRKRSRLEVRRTTSVSRLPRSQIRATTTS
jgi:hypothetical protein